MITKPTLILDENKCRKNIEAMYLKARRSNTEFRPHFKTHQSIEIGNWFKEYGVKKITVSSLEMAKYFADDWDDITVAFPVNILEIETINALADKIKLNLLVESTDSIEFLSKNLKHQIGFFIKLDVGYHRTGISPNDFEQIDQIIEKSFDSELISFKGFLTHAGHTYHCRTMEEILEIHNETINHLKPIREKYKNKFPDLIISVGDTPSCSVADDFSMFDEIRPGNFVFYDLSQLQIGACKTDQISVALACPIVAIHQDRNEFVIYGGGVHLSKERLEDDEFGTIYGMVIEKTNDTWGEPVPKMYVKSLSQEHGIVTVPEQEISSYKIGDVLMILPVHSCMTANLMDCYLTTAGNTIDRI